MPSSAKRCASPRPMPLAAPVTTATLPSKSCIAASPSSGRSVSAGVYAGGGAARGYMAV